MGLNHSHLPSWLSNNWFFKQVFLLRKIYLSKVSRTYYGQMAEDVALSRFVGDKKDGWFVDVGCYHPIKYNNTWKLYKKGWRGVNIDVDQIKIDAFNIKRRKDVNICRGVSNQKGSMKLYSNGFYSPTVTLDKDFSESDKRNFSNYTVREVEVDTLTAILDKTPYKARPIDVLSVDVEGHDLMVLQSLNFDVYQPHVILVEYDVDNHELLLESELYIFLARKGYQLVNWVGLTLVFKVADFPKEPS